MLRMKSVLGVVLAASALAATALPASAQQLYKATFSLAAETYVQDFVLKPGEYTITLGHVLPGGVDVFRIEGPGGFASMFAGGPQQAPFSDHGRLFIVNIDGKQVLKQLHAGSIGKTFTFPMPKTLKAMARSAEPETPAVTAVER